MTSVLVRAGVAVLALVGACNSPNSNAGAGPADPPRSAPTQEDPVKIRLIARDATFTAVLEDSATAREFAALLPLELTLTDYNRTEKIADLPRPLSTEEAPGGVTPVAGDIAYYAPWGNLAIFYRDFSYSRGLVRLGKLDGDIESLATSAEGSIRVEVGSPSTD